MDAFLRRRTEKDRPVTVRYRQAQSSDFQNRSVAGILQALTDLFVSTLPHPAHRETPMEKAPRESDAWTGHDPCAGVRLALTTGFATGNPYFDQAS
jgi:hypothetical protein